MVLYFLFSVPTAHENSLWGEGTRVDLPETMTSVQVPLTSTFPSGQVHLAPVGLRRHMKSQDILRHGFDAVEKAKPSQEGDLSGWPWMRETPLFVKHYFSEVV